ncbi:MAG TPA: Calx-beta domain-containing protein, partial [Thermoanaerobaculia bacterium]|nr:Calx-beta domain-containing protein [Thermoanaerobaculia bacterium]
MTTTRDIYYMSRIDVYNLSAGDSVSLAVAPTSIAENGGVATITAIRSAASATVTNVTLDINGGTDSGAATLDSDFTQSGAAAWDGPLQRNVYTFQIPAWSTTGTLTLTGKDDSIVEPDETINFRIYKVDTATWDSTLKTVLIDDDDRKVSLAVNNTSIPETGGAATVTVSVSPVNSAEPVDVSLAFSGTAARPADYTTSLTTITIPAGQSSASATISVAGDSVDEPDETIVIDVTSVTNASESGTQQQTITIVDDDVPQVSLELAGSPFVENNTGLATVTARLDKPSYEIVAVDLGFTGTATNATDYTPSATSINIPIGALSGSMTLTGIPDTLDELDETVIVDITAVTGAVESGTQQVTATIPDDDAPPAVTLSLADSPFAESAGIATVTATLNTASSFPVTVDLGFGGTATNAADYTRSGSSITIDPENLSGTITLNALDDALDEPDETVIVDMTAATNATEAGTQQVTATIADDDDPPSVTLSLAGVPWAESGGSVTVTATLGAVSSFPVTVFLAFSGTATNTVDYTRSASSITIDPGNLSGTITLNALDDTLDELDETVIVDITSATNGMEAGVQQVTASLIDDDVPTVTLGLTGSPLAEAGGVATVTATLSSVSASAVTVHLGFSGTASAADYTASATSIAIDVGATTGSITISGNDDALYELNETVVVDVTTVAGGAIEDTTAGEQQVTATITDDDAPPAVTLSLAGSPLAESGGAASVNATLSGPSGLPVTVTLELSGSATYAADYTTAPLAPISLVIPAGSIGATTTLTAVDDTIDEADETVVVDITGVINGIESGTQQVTATIADDDAPPTVTLSLAGSPIAENAGTATVTVTLSAASANVVTVDLGFGGTATSGVDYTRSGPSITIPPGSLSGTATLTAVNDTTDEPDETVIVDITGVTNGTESGTQQVTATIADDDAPPAVTLSLAGSPFAENAGAATVKALLSGPSGLPVTVTLGLSGSATYAADYTTTPAAPIALVIPSGA